MIRSTNRLRSWVHAVLAVTGYATLCLVTLLLLALAGSAIAARAYRIARFRTTGLAGQCRGLGGGRCGSDLWLDVASASSAYEGYSWAEDFWREERQRRRSDRLLYDPYRMWKEKPWTSKLFNIEHTATGNWRPPVQASGNCDGRRLEVWVFGDSSVFGLGAPDEYTMPAYLARELARTYGQCVEARNFGVEGFMSTQEMLALLEQLKWHAPPHVVVFLDGYNDAYCGSRFYASRPAPHCDLPEIRQNIESDIAKPWTVWMNGTALVQGVRTFVRSWHPAPEPPRDYPNAVLDAYAANLATVKALAQAGKFQAFFFWQPTLLYKKNFPDHFEQSVVKSLQLPSRSLIAPVYKAAEQRAGKAGFTFLGDIFQNEHRPVYLDLVHLGPRGNEIVARAIAARIEQADARR